jgi:hypothetical protein
VKALQVHENLSRRTVECEAAIFSFYGRFDSTINSLKELLQRQDIQSTPVRRSIANAYYTRCHYDWRMMKSGDLRQIYTLMADNLDEDLTNSRDLWMWFQSYRRLPDFDMLEAIDRLNGWAAREESIDAYYYLYILHFIRWRQGILQDSNLVINHIRKCNLLAGKLGRIRSFEWVAKESVGCPLVHQSELGKWDNSINFYRNTDPLAMVDGVVKRIKGPQSGSLALGPFEVFFVPSNEFLPGRDENVNVQFYLGFSYEGFRAWSVQRRVR